jgi:hypothetical protein
MNNRKKYGRYRICVAKKTVHLKKANSLKTGVLKAAFMKKYIWEMGSTIRIYFMSKPSGLERKTYNDLKREVREEDIDPLQKVIDKMSIIDGIKKIINERYAKFLNLEFKFVSNMRESDIRINFDTDDGCWSYIGTNCLDEDYNNKPTMNFSWFDVPTVLHEFGHALGMIHEHQNPYNNQISWNKKKVYEWAKDTQGWSKHTADVNILDMPTEEINGSEYDPFSIMLYFYPPELTTNNKGTNENLKLSPSDVFFLNKMYPDAEQTPAEFYKNAYGEDINERQLALKSRTGNFIQNYSLYIIIPVIILLIIIIIVFRK